MFSPFGGATKSSSPAPNPFAPKPTKGATNPFATLSPSNASGTQNFQQNGGFGGFGAPSGGGTKSTSNGFGTPINNDAQRATPSSFKESDAESSDGGRSKKRKGDKKRESSSSLQPGARVTSNGPTTSRPSSAARFNAGVTAPFPPPAIPDSDNPHAQKVYTQLRKDGINPPKWPSNPGDPKNSNKMSKFREEYEAYRDRVRKSLTKAGIIDDPDKRRALKDAIEFKGISEEMCPEFEKIRRITEFDVQGAEKDAESTYAARTRMVKKLARSAAGQEAPLPMDVRSIAALRRTLNYLLDDLLQCDANLPAYHGFLWDRTRAIRRDFTFFSTLEPDELKIQVEVLENIARFHVTSLHLLSKADIKPDDFSEHQEREQLGKTLLSLRDVYDDCNVQGLVCENETEFRAYYLIFHAMTPMIMENLQRQWKPELWRDSDEIRTAVSLVEALQSTSNFHGPLLDGPTMAVSGGHHAYFRIVEDPSTSYTMACFAEIHFAQLRRTILQSISKPLARPQGETTDVSAAVLNSFLRFDTVQEAVDFAEDHGLEFKPDPEAPQDVSRQILKLQRNQQLEHPKLFHQYSRKLVEKKRGNRSLPEVMHRTTYPDPNSQVADEEDKAEEARIIPPASSSESNAPKPNPFGHPAQLSGNPFGSKPAASSSDKPNGVPAPQTQSKSPFSGFSTQTAPAANGPFASAFSSQKLGATSSTAEPAGSKLQDLGSKSASVDFSKPTPDDNAVNKGPGAPKPNPFAALGPNPTNEPSKAAEDRSRFMTAEHSQASTTPKSSPPEPKKSMFPFPTGASTSNAFPGPGGPSSTVAPTAAEKQSQAAPGILNITKTDISGAKPPSLLSTADTSKAAQLGSGSGLAPSPFAPKPSPSGPSLFLASGKQQDAPLANTQEATSSNDLFKPKAPPPPPAPPKDYLGDFTKWFVQGDGGLLDDFQKHVLSGILEDTWTKFHKDEVERKKREEEEALEREIEEFRVKNIRIKTFYKWKRTARELRLGRLRREGREELRAWRVAEAERKREEAAKQAAEEKRKRKEAARAAEEDNNRLSDFIQRKRLKRSQAEEDLLASGVLSGVANEKDQARRIVHRTHASLNMARPTSSGSQGSSTTTTSRRSSGKLQALRDKFTKPIEGFRRSLPPGTSRNTASPEPKSRHSAASERWRLKAMGMVEMPDGTALPERMADEVLYGKHKYSGLDKRPRSSSLTPTTRRHLSTGNTSSPFKSSLLARPQSSASFQLPDPPSKRKRSIEDVVPSETPNKRVMSENEKLIQELRAMREDLEEGAQWFREHNEKFASEMGESQGTTPWDDSI